MKLGFALGGAALALGMSEVAGRVYAGLARKERILTADAILGWRPIPGAVQFDDDLYPHLIEINSQGLRDREYTYARTPNVGRIVVLGDSVVFGSGGVDADKCFTELLEESLPGVEVINLGVPAFSTDQEYLYLREEGLRYRPDVVVLCLFSNDFDPCFTSYCDSNGKPKGYVSLQGDRLVFHDPPELGWWDRLAYASYLFGLADRRLSLSARFHERSRREANLDPAARLRTYEALLDEVVTLCEEHETSPVMVYIPSKAQTLNTSVQQAMHTVAERRTVWALDLTRRESFANGSRQRFYFERDLHLNEAGHRAVADALQELLADRIGSPVVRGP